MTLAIPAEIFRASDIRGIVGEALTSEIIYNIARAYATLAISKGETAVCVARDGRLSGPEFEKALLQGLLDSGMDVTYLGIAPTPILYFATHFLPIPNGIMLTASHNPGNYNGMKSVLQQKVLTSDMIQGLRNCIVNNAFVEKKPGTLQNYDIAPDYYAYIERTVKLKKPLKVVVDAGNGAAGEIGPTLYKHLGCEVIELFCEIRGDFPNHHPDPSKPENVAALIEAVKEHKADIGLAFDGDGDRLGVITNDGEIIWPDHQIMLYAKYALQENPGRSIVFDVKCTKLLADVIRENGGMPIMWRTGHSMIKAKIKEANAIFGGEMSGHLFFNDRWFGFDDAIYSGARLLEILSSQNKTSSELFKEIPILMATPEINIKVPESEKFQIVETLAEKSPFEGAEIIDIDGVRAEYPDGWGLVRASNTSPCLVLRFEANNEAALKRIQNEFKKQLLMVQSNLEIPF